MILVDDKQVEALEARRIAEDQDQLNQEPPPTYASLQSSPANGGSPQVAKTINYVSIARSHSSVKETLIVDPTLAIPLFLRPPLAPGETEETRKNLRLESIHGHVHADITLVDDAMLAGEIQPAKRNRRVLMHMKSTHGGITAKIHGPQNRSAFVLKAQAVNGDIRLHIPRTFHGPVIVLHRHGFVRFSDDVSRNLTTFGEVDSTRRCFLGDFSKWSDAGAGWKGDELEVEVRHGNVKIHYDDDLVGAPVKTRPTFLNRVFGF
ncbi:hypothetical protein HYPSUDRAFT_172720 [Hypholoma sublateritium FD-334 SS-4]|uniref:DUF7330 domain-containing protein n=1 Tax=Hypholoma sublateritium (strain FD-334 SS-4) TaxID=945553 RepID=A0A0D2KL03_HYPSF|nr:hypothetical protein HYPSUDRAFT_172720 [Hypholoma sublateritium FD-334 SS-4]